jgi:hypothetical protein
MQFEQKTITILDEDRKPVEVTRWQGVGTGLAYQHPIYQDPTQGNSVLQGEGFILVHVPSGMCITKLTLPTEPEAQTFLEAVAALDPDQWNIDLEEYKKRYFYKGRVSEMRSKIEAAHEASLIPHDHIFIYALDADNDIIYGADQDVESDNPEDERTKQMVADCFKTHPAACEIVLTCQDGKTGNHKLLHTYKRPAETNATPATSGRLDARA